MRRLNPLVLLLPLLLWGCILTPGKFVSTLDVRADRSFAFTYVGEVWALDLGNEMAKGLVEPEDKDAKPEPSAKRIAWQTEAGGDDDADLDRKNAAIAEALRKEAGYRKVDYLGGGRFAIDYAISGRLTHNFIYPFNVDAQAIFPFVAIELRGKDGVRVKAPAFAATTNSKGIPGREGLGDKLDGTFTLTTDAEIVSQNNEGGSTAGAGGAKSITWKATPLTKDAPMAVLRVAPLP